MPRSCKCCKSDKREWIEQQLVLKTSRDTISKLLRETWNVSISATSLLRHEFNCMGVNRESPIKDKRPEAQQVTATVRKLDADKVIAEAREKGVNDAQLAATMLRDVVTNQLAIVQVLQRQYMEGEIPCPIEDYRGLEILSKCLREEAVISNLDINPEIDLHAKADLICQSVLDGNLSPANGERLLGLLQKRIDISDTQKLLDRVEEVKRLVEGGI